MFWLFKTNAPFSDWHFINKFTSVKWKKGEHLQSKWNFLLSEVFRGFFFNFWFHWKRWNRLLFFLCLITVLLCTGLIQVSHSHSSTVHINHSAIKVIYRSWWRCFLAVFLVNSPRAISDCIFYSVYNFDFFPPPFSTLTKSLASSWLL